MMKPVATVLPIFRADGRDRFGLITDDGIVDLTDKVPYAGLKEAIETLVASLDREATIPMDARAYRWDITLRGRRSTMFENRMEGS